jgi:hypothetical protein
MLATAGVHLWKIEPPDGHVQWNEGNMNIKERRLRLSDQLVPELNERLDKRARLEITVTIG